MDYERLSGLDNSFLLQEGPSTYMHIACTAVFEPGPLIGAGGGVDIGAIRRYVASRIHLLPRYRQRLASIPVTNDPIWVDDERFNVGYHVRHSSLPKPGGDGQLRELCGRILERQLDRARPLWECWFIEGLADGRFAMLTKVHHCMVDGIGGVDLLAALLGLEPSTNIEQAQPWEPRSAPSGASLLRKESFRRAGSAITAVAGFARGTRNRAPLISGAREAASGVWSLLRTGLEPSAALPFNRPVGPHRRIEWFHIDMAEIKAIRETLGGTVNDVVLATVAGAMGSFLRDVGIDTSTTPFRAAVPVSVRSTDQRGRTGNRVAAWLAELPINERDAWRRLVRVRAVTARLKADHQAAGAQALTEVAEWTGTAALGLALRLLSRASPHNIIVTNVPGPPVPLYLLDARVASLYPHLPLFENQGLGIALLSYSGVLAWGLAADWELVPDLALVRDALERAFAELREMALLAQQQRSRVAANGSHINDSHRNGNNANARPALKIVRASEDELHEER